MGVTEGVYPDGCSMPMVYQAAPLALKFLSVYVLRTTLPQSRIRSTAPSGREPGMGAYHSMCRSEIGRLRAIFIAPTETLVFLPFTFIGRHSLSLAFARQLPQRGSQERLRGAGAIHRGTCETVGVRAIFIAPTETLIFLPFTFIGGYSLRVGAQNKTPLRGFGGGNLIAPSGSGWRSGFGRWCCR